MLAVAQPRVQIHVRRVGALAVRRDVPLRPCDAIVVMKRLQVGYLGPADARSGADEVIFYVLQTQRTIRDVDGAGVTVMFIVPSAVVGFQLLVTR